MPKKLSEEFIKNIFEKVKAGDLEVLESIKKLKLVDQIMLLNKRDAFGWSVLHWAIYENKDLLVKPLVDLYLSEEIKIGIELRTGRGFYHGDETPLHIALRYCRSRQSEVRDALIMLLLNSGADINSIDQNGMTALHWAAARDRVAIITHVIQRNNYELILKQNTRGNTALHEAVEHTNFAAINTLASVHHGVLLHIQNHQQNTPLELMKVSQNDEIKNLANRLSRKPHQSDHTLREFINNRYLLMFQQMPNRTGVEKRTRDREPSSVMVKKNKR